MISKIFVTGKSFGETCRYVCADLTKSRVLAVEGVRGHDLRLMQKDFELQHSFTPQKEKPVFHGVLSFPHGEDPGQGKMVEIGRKYLEQIEMANTQYALILHTDKEHLHVHILANRVNNDGQIIGQGLIIKRGARAAEKLTKEYGLKPENGKNLRETNFAALHPADAKRYRLYGIIRDLLPGCQRLEDLERGLLEKGINTRYRYDPVSRARWGISFRFEEHCFKGSHVDAAYSLKNLERTMLLNQGLALEQEREKEVALRQEEGRKLALREAQEKELVSFLQGKTKRPPQEDGIEEQTGPLRHSRGMRHGR